MWQVFGDRIYKMFQDLHVNPEESCKSCLKLSQNDDARDALQVRPDVEQRPDRFINQIPDPLALVKSDLHQQVAVWVQESWGIGK